MLCDILRRSLSDAAKRCTRKLSRNCRPDLSNCGVQFHWPFIDYAILDLLTCLSFRLMNFFLHVFFLFLFFFSFLWTVRMYVSVVCATFASCCASLYNKPINQWRRYVYHHQDLSSWQYSECQRRKNKKKKQNKEDMARCIKEDQLERAITDKKLIWCWQTRADAFRVQLRSPNMVPFDILDIRLQKMSWA